MKCFFLWFTYSYFKIPKDQPFMGVVHVHALLYICGSYASGAFSAFVRVSRHKTFCCVLFCYPVSCLYLFLSNKHFQVQSSSSICIAVYFQILSLPTSASRWGITIVLPYLPSFNGFNPFMDSCIGWNYEPADSVGGEFFTDKALLITNSLFNANFFFTRISLLNVE